MKIEEVEDIIKIFKTKVVSPNQLYEHQGKIQETDILTLKIFNKTGEKAFGSLQFWNYPTVDEYTIKIFIRQNECNCSEYKIAKLLLNELN